MDHEKTGREDASESTMEGVEKPLIFLLGLTLKLWHLRCCDAFFDALELHVGDEVSSDRVVEIDCQRQLLH